MAKTVKVNTALEKWNTKNGKSVRIVTRTRDGKFYDNLSMAELIK
jgi:hypothetical protein